MCDLLPQYIENEKLREVLSNRALQLDMTWRTESEWNSDALFFLFYLFLCLFNLFIYFEEILGKLKM